MTYFLDTNIVSYILKGNQPVLEKVETLVKNKVDIALPVIAYYEVKRGLISSGAQKKLTLFLNFAMKVGVVDLKTSTLDLASLIYADLKKQGNVIEDDDIFIGASAIEHNAILVTNNERHLGRIKDLKIEVWDGEDVDPVATAVSLAVDLAIDVPIGGIIGEKLSNTSLKGITSGKGSMLSVAKQMDTKVANGTIKSINNLRKQTFLKMAVGRNANGCILSGTVAGNAVADKGLSSPKQKLKDFITDKIKQMLD